MRSFARSDQTVDGVLRSRGGTVTGQGSEHPYGEFLDQAAGKLGRVSPAKPGPSR